MKIIEDISYGDSKNNVFDLYLSEKKAAPVFIYFHGGGLERGSYKNKRSSMIQLAENGITAISAEYRMYPEAGFPDFLNDAADVVLWVQNNLKKYTDFNGIFIGGSSAGGYITQMLCFNPQYFNDRGISLESISGFVHDAGQPTTHFNVLRERGICKKDGSYDLCRVLVDEAAPMYYIDGTQEYPPMKFIVSDNDLPNRRKQTELMLTIMKNYGYDMSKIEFKVMENSTHCSYKDKDGRELLADEIYNFIIKNKIPGISCPKVFG